VAKLGLTVLLSLICFLSLCCIGLLSFRGVAWLNLVERTG